MNSKYGKDTFRSSPDSLEKISNLKVEVIGCLVNCVVNGPGEAKEADIGIAGGHGTGIIFKKGEVFKKLPEAELLPAFLEELRKMEAANDYFL